MATIARGSRDQAVERMRDVLDEYERDHPGAIATLYRHHSAGVRIRIIDERFNTMSTPDRHDHAWNYIASRLGSEEIQEISVLLLISSREKNTEFMNTEFDDPVPCNF